MKIKTIVLASALVMGVSVACATDTPSMDPSENIAEIVGFIDINQADIATFTQLQGIGEARARSIVEYRERYGPFLTVDELADVSGISEQIVEMNRERLIVDR